MHYTTVVFSVLALATGINAGTLTQTSTAASCTPTPNLPKPKTIICNGRGTLTQTAAVLPGYPQQVADLDACRNACMDEPMCISFGYVEDGSTCRLFSKPLIKQGYKKNPQTAEAFYNRRCFKNKCTCPQEDMPDLCGESCFDTETDDNNCGGCGIKCNTELLEFCDRGTCRTLGIGVC